MLMLTLLVFVPHALVSGQLVVTTSCKQTRSCIAAYTDEELKQRLTPVQYKVTQQKGTEPRYSSGYLNNKEHGIYSCVVCGNQMYSSNHKYDSRSGWPSFYDVIGGGRVDIVKDYSHGMVRDEVICAKCGAHHGHVFNDGPPPTYLRYCINSAAMNFIPGDKGPMTPIL